MNARERGFIINAIAPTIQVNVNIDPAALTPAQAGEYAAAVIAKLTTDLTATPTSAPGSAAHIVGIDKQLARLMDHNPAFAVRVKGLHYDLAGIGYVPTLPNSKQGQLPSYISYIDPVTGQNLGNLNSEKFYVMRAALREQLKDQLHFGADSRYAHCHLTSDEAVKAVAKLAKAEQAPQVP